MWIMMAFGQASRSRLTAAWPRWSEPLSTMTNTRGASLYSGKLMTSAHSFGLAIYSAASDRYEDALLRTGLPTGTPQEALDTACTIHLTEPGHEPEP